MISYGVDESGRFLTISYSGHVGLREFENLVETVRNGIGRLRRDVIFLGDLTHLESMDPACATGLGTIMELLDEHGVALILRVIPDPAKDIGFNLISQFHLRGNVRIHTVPNLAEALKILLDEAPALTGAA